jgi:hypothetical protein
MKLLATFDADLSYSVEARTKDRLRLSVPAKRKTRGARTVMAPDVLLASSVVFLTKLFWGCDGKPRYSFELLRTTTYVNADCRFPESSDDLMIGLPELSAWLNTLEKLRSAPADGDASVLLRFVDRPIVS